MKITDSRYDTISLYKLPLFHLILSELLNYASGQLLHFMSMGVLLLISVVLLFVVFYVDGPMFFILSCYKESEK